MVLPAFIRQRFGEDGFHVWLQALSPEARQTYSGSININDWYPIRSCYLEPTEALCRLFFDGNLRGAWEVGRYSAEYALTGVYRAFVKLTSIQLFVKRAGVMLPTYYRPSALEIVSLEGNGTVMHLTQFPEPNPFAEHRIGGWIEKALEIHGCQQVEVSITSSLTQGNPYTEFVIRWRR